MVIVDYKMKLELGVHAGEIQRNWYGKRGVHSMASMSLRKLVLEKSELKFLMSGVKIPSKMPGLPTVPLMLVLPGWRKFFQTFMSICSLVGIFFS